MTTSINALTDNILMVGFMTSGKSTIGKYISRKLKYHFLDTDQLIENTLNMSINDIFLSKGETFFRKVENKIMECLHGLKQHVISTGGGMPIIPDGMRKLKNAGTVIYLEASLPTLIARLKNNVRRPLLNNTKQSKEAGPALVTRLFKERQSQYQQAHLRVPLVDQDSLKTATAVLHTLGQNGFENPLFKEQPAT